MIMFDRVNFKNQTLQCACASVTRACRMAAMVSILGLSAGPASAAVLTWELQNVTFNDGGTASGSFVFDSETFQVSDWSITVSPWTYLFPDVFSGPDTQTVPAYTYSPAVGGGVASFSTEPPAYGYITFIDPSQFYPGDSPNPEQLTRQLRLPILEPLDMPGVVALNLESIFGAECWNCAPFRSFTAGSVVAIPEPATSAMMLAGLIGLAGMSRHASRRRVRSLAAQGPRNVEKESDQKPGESDPTACGARNLA